MHATFVTCECDTTNYEVSYVLRIGIIYLRQLNLHNTWCTLHLWCVHWSMLSLHLSLCHSATSFGHKYLSHTTLSDVGVHRTWMPTLSGCWGGSPILHLVKVTLSVPQRDNCFTPFIEKNCLLQNGCGLMISYTLSKVLPLLPLTQAFMLVRLFESWVELGVLEINLVLLGGRIGLPIAKYFRIGWRVLIWLLELKPW